MAISQLLFTNRKTVTFSLALALFQVTFTYAALADNAAQIMEKMDALQRQAADQTMTKSRLSTCKFGKNNGRLACTETPRVKVIESVSRQLGSNLKDSQSISILLEPASERGIGMLTYSYDDATKDTESWLYLSALGKVKRMASGTGEDQEPVAVFGSEFTTEDMETGKMDEYTFKILQEGDFGEHQVWVIEGIPKASRKDKTYYSKILYWIDKERYVVLKQQTYDKQGKAYKQLLFKDIEQINGLWLARDVTLLNLKTRRLSNMKTEAIAMHVEVDEEFLTQRTLTDFAFREKTLTALRQVFE